MKVTVFILVKCCVFLLIKGQAPGDRQQICRTDFRYYDGLHDWVPYVNDTSVGVRGDVKWQVLLDQYDYQNILGGGIPPGVWTARDVDGDGNQMTQSGSPCTNSLRIRNTFSNPNSNNWVFTQAVNYLDAVEVIVNATVRFSGCIQRNGLTPPCLNNFVNLHRYDTDSQRTQSDVTNTANYQPYLGNLMASRLGSEVEGSVSVINSFPRPNSALTYFGIQDVGSYGDIQRIIVYYRVAQGYEQGLVICPNVALPKEGSGNTNSRNCTCKTNATAITSLERKCNDIGVCEENPVCACSPGYQYNTMMGACEACPVGMYKHDVSNTSCLPCPVNSTAESTASTVCECICGTTRDPTKLNDPCQDIATFIRNHSDFPTSTTIPPITALPTENVTIRCPLGTYQLESQGDCLPCPRNTNTSTYSFENATICPCSSGYYRANFEGPEIDCTRPPSTCRNIIAISVEEQTVSISWSKPDNTGRDDFYYIVEYSDGESIGSVPVVSEEKVVQYSIGGLRPATDYTITVTVENGVSDQDQRNEYLRRCELKLTTQEGKPSPPNDFQSLCDVIVWGMPSNPNGDITAYEAQFYIPGTENGRLVEIPQSRTFYIVKEEDKLGGDISTFVRVRAKSRAGGGKWSDGKRLGCDFVATTPPATVCPPCDCPNDQSLPTTVSATIGSASTESTGTSAPISSVYFSLGGQVYSNNSVLSLTDIGEGASALLCKTNLSNCCKSVPFRFGQFYYPDGDKVPIRSGNSGFYRDRGDQEIRLNRRDGITSPVGKFRCEIPDADGVSQNLIITLV